MMPDRHRRWAILLMLGVGAWNVAGRYLGLALGLSLSSNALRLKVHRITRRLRQCVLRCVDQGGMNGVVPVGPHLVKG